MTSRTYLEPPSTPVGGAARKTSTAELHRGTAKAMQLRSPPTSSNNKNQPVKLGPTRRVHSALRGCPSSSLVVLCVGLHLAYIARSLDSQRMPLLDSHSFFCSFSFLALAHKALIDLAQSLIQPSCPLVPTGQIPHSLQDSFCLEIGISRSRLPNFQLAQEPSRREHRKRRPVVAAWNFESCLSSLV